MKSGTTSSDSTRRNIEAQILRADAATLPASSRILYTGDFNDDNTDTYFATMTASGPGQSLDPLNVSNWTNNTNGILTESATNLRYRDDLELITQNVLNDATGLKWISGTYHTFGNNGSVAKGGTVNSGSNTALTGLPNRSGVISALTTASDHLPVVADYTVPDPSNGDFDHDSDTDMSDFGHLQACLTDSSAPAAGCADADMDGDGVIGSADVDLFTNCLAGADQAPGC